jgi:isopenicillin-N epimerase
LLAERWRTPALVPEEMLAAMATVLLPHHGIATQAAADAIHARLLAHRIEVPVLCFDDRLWVRVSAQVYNAAGDFQQLADTVAAL